MKVARIRAFCIGIIVVAVSAQAALAQAPPPPPQPTLWSFLGIPKWKKVKVKLFNRRGNMPKLEPKPPMLPIADLANLKSDIPALKKAAEIKIQEDLKKQKIKAVKFLASIGCGCYDKDGGITEAMTAAMDDCTEGVRLATIKAIASSAKDGYCDECKQSGCCNKKIVDKLSEIANKMKDDGCWAEPSERVREAATKALCECCPGTGPAPPVEEKEVPQTPGKETPEKPTPDPNVQNKSPDGQHSSRRTAMRPISLPGEAYAPSLLPVAEDLPETGEVEFVNSSRGTARIGFDDEGHVPVGYRLEVRHKYLLSGSSVVGQVVVVKTEPGTAIVRPVEGTRLAKISRGDEATVLVP